MNWQELGSPRLWVQDVCAGVFLICFAVGAFVLAFALAAPPR
jgi:hypothetical protein